VQRELSLEFCLPAGPHRMEQSWPTRDAGAAKQSRRSSRVISLRRLAFFQPIAVLAAARYWGSGLGNHFMDLDHLLLVHSFAMGWLDFLGRCESLAIEARS